MTIETGLSGHRKMTISVLKIFCKKKEPAHINYHSYKKFSESDFRNDLLSSLQDCNPMKYDEFLKIFMQVLNSHAPSRKVVVRGNKQPFMNKTLSKAFMHRSKVKNQYNKNPIELSKNNSNKQRNFCVSLLTKEKKKYYNNLELKIFNDNKLFWQHIKLMFSNKQNVLQANIIIGKS